MRHSERAKLGEPVEAVAKTQANLPSPSKKGGKAIFALPPPNLTLRFLLFT